MLTDRRNRHLFYQKDGPQSAHYANGTWTNYVRSLLNTKLRNRWIGRGRTIHYIATKMPWFSNQWFLALGIYSWQIVQKSTSSLTVETDELAWWRGGRCDTIFRHQGILVSILVTLNSFCEFCLITSFSCLPVIDNNQVYNEVLINTEWFAMVLWA